MRDALGIDKSVDILDHIYSLPESEQNEAHEKIQAVERKAMMDMEPRSGLQELMDYIKEQSLPKAICTRNFPIPVNHLLTNFLPGHQFGPVITREFTPPKPHPAGILHIAESWGIPPQNLVMVGDSVDDMESGHRAGAATVLIKSEVNSHLNHVPETDYVIEKLDDLIPILDRGFEAKPKN